MDELETGIDTFERTYLPKLRQWCAMVAPEDIESLEQTLTALDRDSRAISAALGPTSELAPRWRTLLDTIRGMLPSIENHLARVRDESGTALEALDKGRHVLATYRNTLPGGEGKRIDSSG